MYLSLGPCSLLPLVSYSFDGQGGACSVSEYAQQIGRAGRVRAQAVCACFFNLRDSCGVRQHINEKMMSESEPSTLFTKIVDRTTVSGRTSFLHVADFRAACVGPMQVSHVLAALQRLGSCRAVKAVPCRAAVRPGKNVFDGNEGLSDDNALSLWGGNIWTQFRRPSAHRVPMARFYVRAVCGAVPFLYRGAAGPAAVHEAVEEKRNEGLLVVDTSENFTNVTPLNIVADIEQDGLPKRLVDMLKADSQADLESLLDTYSFLKSSGCINRQPASRFGAESEVGLPLSNCLCSGCAPDRPSLRARCPILPEVEIWYPLSIYDRLRVWSVLFRFSSSPACVLFMPFTRCIFTCTRLDTLVFF